MCVQYGTKADSARKKTGTLRPLAASDGIGMQRSPTVPKVMAQRVLKTPTSEVDAKLREPARALGEDDDACSASVVRYMPLYVMNKDIKLDKQPPPTVQTLSVERGFKTAAWCQDIIAWLRGRGKLTFFLAAVTGRATLVTDADSTIGISEEAVRLDA